METWLISTIYIESLHQRNCKSVDSQNSIVERSLFDLIVKAKLMIKSNLGRKYVKCQVMELLCKNGFTI